MKLANLFQSIPAELPQEISQTILSADSVKIERIVSKGHCSPPDFWYDQSQHEWVLVVAGEAKLQIENDVVHVRAGDYINIPAHVKHRVVWTHPTQETIWLAVFYAAA